MICEKVLLERGQHPSAFRPYSIYMKHEDAKLRNSSQHPEPEIALLNII